MECLGRDELHLWYTEPDSITPALLREYAGLLCPQERADQQRLVRPELRDRHLISRALTRTVLSRYADVPPAEWVMRRTQWGRPEIQSPSDTKLSFSLSHTRGCIALLVSTASDAGVDVEAVDGYPDLAIATRFFSTAEATALAALLPDERRSRFLELWTLKEAYLKARGLGLTMPLDAVSLDISGDNAVTAHFDGRLDDDASGWSFQLIRPTPLHVGAVAARSHVPPRIVTRQTIPLS
jgi:4'-phosphopantetheinyl transferase